MSSPGVPRGMDPLQDLLPGQYGDLLLGLRQWELRVKSGGHERHEGQEEG